MLDPQLLRNDIETVARRLATRAFMLDVVEFQAIDQRYKDVLSRTQELQAKRNLLAKEIGRFKGKGGDATSLMLEANELNEQLSALLSQQDKVLKERGEFLAVVPNIPHESVPVGKSSEDNQEMRRVGTPREFDFPVKDHVDIGAGLKLLDFDTATKIAGARFALMKGPLARLHRAITQFMLDVHTGEHGYTEIYAPYIVNADSMWSTGQLPNFEDDLFKVPRKKTETSPRLAQAPGGEYLRGAKGELFTIKNENWYLIPTSEVSVTNIVRDEIVPLESLPLKFVCHSPCFRSEAGSYGKDTRGMIRNHQFDKVEQASGGPLPRCDALHGRHGVRCSEDLRHRSLAVGPERLSGDFLVQQLRGVPGATHAGALPQREGKARAGAHPKRIWARRGAHLDRDHGELSARRWRRGHPGGVAAVYGRTQGHRTDALTLGAGKMRPIGEVTERLNVPVSKTGIRASVSWVRIPPSPPHT